MTLIQARSGRAAGSPEGDTSGHRARAAGITLAVPLAIVLGTLLLRFVAPSVYEPLVAEDGIYEWATCLAYAAGAVLAAIVAVRLRTSDRLIALAFGVLAVGLFLVAGEEISWGERLLGFQGPETLRELNRQDEANLHNLLHNSVLHLAYIGVGLYGGLAARRVLPRLLGARRASFLAPTARLAGWFLVPAAVFAYVIYEDWGNRILGEQLGRLQEAAEAVLSIGFLCFLLAVRRNVEAQPLPER
jgi:hypothetical protein